MPWRGPEYEGERPTLGWYVLDWMMQNLAQPGRDDGEPFVPTREQAEFLCGYYEVHPVTGKRLIRRALLSRPRGWGKSPFVGAIALAEACADVVADGFDAYGEPIGRAVALGPYAARAYRRGDRAADRQHVDTAAGDGTRPRPRGRLRARRPRHRDLPAARRDLSDHLVGDLGQGRPGVLRVARPDRGMARVERRRPAREGDAFQRDEDRRQPDRDAERVHPGRGVRRRELCGRLSGDHRRAVAGAGHPRRPP